MKIFISHVGYGRNNSKRAVLKENPSFSGKNYTIRDRETDEVLYTGDIKKVGTVDRWKDWFFYTLDFSNFTTMGRFYIEINGYRSDYFEITETIFDKNLHHEILSYFKANRSAGKWDRYDRSVAFVGDRDDRKDVHGGWYDASGDYSKYLSHLSYANYMNPQQTPASVWHMLKLLENVDKTQHPTVKFRQRVIEEALFGADFLMRMFDEEGYFYSIVFDKWSKDVNQREICAYETMSGNKYDNYQAGYRQGAGLSIAALAKAYTFHTDDSDFPKEHYLEVVTKAFDHLEKNNIKYLDNGEENIIDDYCALLAATELFKVTGDKKHKKAADRRAKNLMNRQISDENFQNWFRADNSTRPFFHAAEAGFPVISLIEYLNITDNSDDVIAVIKKALQYELDITSEVNNPFGYARQYTRELNGTQKSTFFVPHQNETGYWWQGENARLASLSAAAYMGALLFQDDNEFAESLKEYANNQIYWIFGLNPYDMCMYYGRGRNIPEYEPEWPSVPGGVCNGITSGFLDEQDIDFRPETANTGDNTWRWGEQWIPHASWFLFASSIIE